MRLVRLRAPGGLENLKLVEENPPKSRPGDAWHHATQENDFFRVHNCRGSQIKRRGHSGVTTQQSAKGNAIVTFSDAAEAATYAKT